MEKIFFEKAQSLKLKVDSRQRTAWGAKLSFAALW
jgi:hypothetical protein